MMTMPTTAPLTHDEAMALQTVEFDRAVALLRTFGPDDWSAPVVECPGWEVLTMYRHVLGASEAGASMRENAHQMHHAMSYRRRNGGPLEAALTTVQIGDRADFDAAAVVERLATAGPRCVRGRRRIPGFVRRAVRTKIDGPVFETWNLGYLVDTIYLRDLWMHRIDACRATGREPVLDAAHDGRIVADVVAEWARRHGRPYALTLTGAAGGTFERDAASPGAEHRTIDAVEFCRALTGRTDAPGLLATIVPF